MQNASAAAACPEVREGEGWEGRSTQFTILLSVYSIVGTVGNLLIVRVYHREKGKATHAAYIYTLALVDLTVCVVIMPYTLFYERKEIWSDVTCRLLEVLRHTLVMASSLLLLVIAAERYQAVFRPWRAATVRTAKRSILAVFIASAVCGCPAVSIFAVMTTTSAPASAPASAAETSATSNDYSSAIWSNASSGSGSQHQHQTTTMMTTTTTTTTTTTPTPCPQLHLAPSSHAHCQFTTELLGGTWALLYQAFLAFQFFASVAVMGVLYVKVYRNIWTRVQWLKKLSPGAPQKTSSPPQPPPPPSSSYTSGVSKLKSKVTQGRVGDGGQRPAPADNVPPSPPSSCFPSVVKLTKVSRGKVSDGTCLGQAPSGPKQAWSTKESGLYPAVHATLSSSALTAGKSNGVSPGNTPVESPSSLTDGKLGCSSTSNGKNNALYPTITPVLSRPSETDDNTSEVRPSDANDSNSSQKYTKATIQTVGMTPEPCSLHTHTAIPTKSDSCSFDTKDTSSVRHIDNLTNSHCGSFDSKDHNNANSHTADSFDTKHSDLEIDDIETDEERDSDSDGGYAPGEEEGEEEENSEILGAIEESGKGTPTAAEAEKVLLKVPRKRARKLRSSREGTPRISVPCQNHPVQIVIHPPSRLGDHTTDNNASNDANNNNKTTTNTTTSNNKNNFAHDKRRKAGTMLFVGTLLYVLSWLPFWLDVFGATDSLAFRYTFLLGHVTNPLVYGVVNTKVRAKVKRLLLCRGG